MFSIAAQRLLLHPYPAWAGSTCAGNPAPPLQLFIAHRRVKSLDTIRIIVQHSLQQCGDHHHLSRHHLALQSTSRMIQHNPSTTQGTLVGDPILVPVFYRLTRHRTTSRGSIVDGEKTRHKKGKPSPPFGRELSNATTAFD